MYRKTLVPKIIEPSKALRFETPCPSVWTEDFIATLQRALLARGYFNGIVSGRMDDATRAAVRRYQTEQGLESATLSLDTARTLGLVAIDLTDLDAAR
ncbi:peptidoglycan-binding protein [Cognatishimia sp. F0-27]|nr:peptidoglycan-binding protein [Cognatishimia sp. F0-27]